VLQQIWAGENRRITVCVDSYNAGILKGRCYNGFQEMEQFESLIQFLLGVENFLEEQQIPQSYTAVRRFSDFLPAGESGVSTGRILKETKATFEVQVLFRQHTSWQGVIIWKERKLEQSFRSVLELVMLMDSALRDAERGAAS